MKSICISFIFSLCLVLAGISLICLRTSVFTWIKDNNLLLRPNSSVYDVWKRPPFSVPMNFYFFNWTNPEDIHNNSVKPRFEQVGPYKFLENQEKTDVIWNENGTVSFKRLRFWKYINEEDNAKLEDNITTLNPVALATAHVSRTWHYLIRKAVSLTLSRSSSTLAITRTVEELLFAGYPDTLIKIANTFPFFHSQKLPPWDRFGWFYARNGSSDFEGVFTVGTGRNTTFGKMYEWNHRRQSPFFEGRCAKVDGSFGEFFQPCDGDDEFISLFSSDLCRKLFLQYAGEQTVGGVTGRKYVVGDYVLDNGTLYPENECFCNGECLPFGVFNVSSCRYGSPSFGSLPHFYKADPYYGGLIEGMQPNKQQHEFYVVVEPVTGMMLKACVRLQLNLLLQPIPVVAIYEDAPRVFFPMLWFEQKFQLPKNDVFLLKILLRIPLICCAVGISAVLLGSILFFYTYLKRYSFNSFTKRQYQCQHENIPLRNENCEAKII